MSTEPWVVRWYYQCLRCGYTSSSIDPNLTTCTAQFPISPNGGTPCGGEFRDEDPYTYRWQLVEAGEIS